MKETKPQNSHWMTEQFAEYTTNIHVCRHKEHVTWVSFLLSRDTWPIKCPLRPFWFSAAFTKGSRQFYSWEPRQSLHTFLSCRTSGSAWQSWGREEYNGWKAVKVQFFPQTEVFQNEDAELILQKGAQQVRTELVSQRVCICESLTLKGSAVLNATAALSSPERDLTRSTQKLPPGQFSTPWDHFTSSCTSKPLSPLERWQSCPWCSLSYLLFPALAEHRESHTHLKKLISSDSGQYDKIQLDSGDTNAAARCLLHQQQEDLLQTVKFELTRT